MLRAVEASRVAACKNAVGLPFGLDCEVKQKRHSSKAYSEDIYEVNVRLMSVPLAPTKMLSLLSLPYILKPP